MKLYDPRMENTYLLQPKNRTYIYCDPRMEHKLYTYIQRPKNGAYGIVIATQEWNIYICSDPRVENIHIYGFVISTQEWNVHIKRPKNGTYIYTALLLQPRNGMYIYTTIFIATY